MEDFPKLYTIEFSHRIGFDEDDPYHENMFYFQGKAISAAPKLWPFQQALFNTSITTTKPQWTLVSLLNIPKMRHAKSYLIYTKDIGSSV